MRGFAEIFVTAAKPILRTPYHLFLGGCRMLTRGLFRLLSFAIGRERFLRLSHGIAGEFDSTIDVAGIRFDAAQPIPLHRARTLLTKETETIAFLDRFVGEGDIYYDVGANVGVFTLYAALKRNATVVAFEPFAPNYSLLNKNLFLNALSDRVVALNIALSDSTKLSVLNVSEFWPGKAGHSFENPLGSSQEAFTPTFKQGVIGMSLDDFIATYRPPFPNHVKIDVDGNEHKVVAGMVKTLGDPRLKSVSVELNVGVHEHKRLVEMIQAFGFSLLGDAQFLKPDALERGYVVNHFFVRRSETSEGINAARAGT